METIRCIETRRSIRKYKRGDVPEETVREILSAAMCAPSAGNAQPWEFVVVRDKDKLAGVKEFNPYANMVTQVPVGILVSGNLSREKFPGFWVQDCSAAVENILLAVHSLGLGAVWTGIYPLEERVEKCRGLFDLPDHIVPLAFIPVGPPAQEAKKQDRFHQGRVHYETW